MPPTPRFGHSDGRPAAARFALRRQRLENQDGTASRLRRGLRGVKLVISDSHEGVKAAASKVLKATWQRCRVHFMRNALAHAGKTQRRMVSAAIGTVFVQESPEAARAQWRSVADQLRGKFPKLGAPMDEAEHDVLAFMTFPRAHWALDARAPRVGEQVAVTARRRRPGLPARADARRRRACR
jgi:transposase-like protein